MHTQYLGAAIALIVALAAAAGCAPADPPPTGSTSAADSAQTDSATTAPTAETRAAPAPLSGTSWQLVQIMSMDDSTYTPDDRSLYTLQFDADGTARIRADCNRGSGTWSSASPGQLVFGAIATTRAMCPPDSLHDRYLAQFQWVRSFVMENGHLFLATMADGAIIEFEPVGGEPVAATVPGDEVRTTDADERQAIIQGTLFNQYAAERGIRAGQTGIDAFIRRPDQAAATNPAERAARSDAIDRRLADHDPSFAKRTSLQQGRDSAAEARAFAVPPRERQEG